MPLCQCTHKTEHSTSGQCHTHAEPSSDLAHPVSFQTSSAARVHFHSTATPDNPAQTTQDNNSCKLHCRTASMFCRPVLPACETQASSRQGHSDHFRAFASNSAHSESALVALRNSVRQSTSMLQRTSSSSVQALLPEQPLQLWAHSDPMIRQSQLKHLRWLILGGVLRDIQPQMLLQRTNILLS